MKYISIISRLSTQYRNDYLQDIHLTGYQYTYILNICRNPGISQEKLSEIIYINKSNVTRQLYSLERNGFVERRFSENDKRVMELYPTEKALEAYPKVVEVLQEWNNYLTSDFNDEEREIMSGLLEKMMNKAIKYIKSEK